MGSGIKSSLGFSNLSHIVEVGIGNLNTGKNRSSYLKTCVGSGIKSSFERSFGSYNFRNIFEVGGLGRSSIKSCLERSFSISYFGGVFKVGGRDLNSSEDRSSGLKAGVGGSVESGFEKSFGFFHLGDIFKVGSLGSEGSMVAGLVLCDSGQVSGCGFGDFGSQLDGDGGGASQQRDNYQFHVGESGPKNLPSELSR